MIYIHSTLLYINCINYIIAYKRCKRITLLNQLIKESYVKPAQRMSESELMSSLGFKRLAWLVVTKNLQEDRLNILQQFYDYILPTHRKYIYKVMFIGTFRGVEYYTIPFIRDVTSDKLDLVKLKQHYLDKIVVIDGHVKRSGMR